MTGTKPIESDAPSIRDFVTEVRYLVSRTPSGRFGTM